MRRKMMLGLAVALAGAAGTTMAGAAPAAHPAAEAQALDLAKQSIALRSVQGPGNQTPQVAALYRDALLAGGFAPSDVTVTPFEDTAYLIARWPGQDRSLKPLVVSGHMDVVEAKPSDWQRDPFTPVIENGYLYGRGATDMKLDDTLAVAALIELRREGYKPRRDIVLAFSGDEETTMKTGKIIADTLASSEIVLNVDGADGTLDEKTGAPRFFAWSGAEKTYADFELSVSNPGGHSSEPRPENAIAQLAQALVRIGQYRFKAELSPLTRASLSEMARYKPARIAAAMRAFVANPADKAAIDVLTNDPASVGKIGTTCVATMVSGGHALNALPQHASANINCRIFPGHKPADIMAELQRVAAEPSVHFADVTAGSVATDASPMRADFIAAVRKAVDAAYPGTPVFPTLSAGASDSMWFRSHGVPSYGASPLYIKASEDFMHGLNERTPVADVRPSVDYMLAIVPLLTN